MAQGSLYHPATADTAHTVPSYWEATAGPPPEGCVPLAGDEACDIAVIGGGYTGLSAALHLARDLGVDVRVLEAGRIGWGASGRNGGFNCVGAAKLSGAAMLKRVGRDEVRRYYAAQVEATELVAQLSQDEGIDFDRQGDGVISVAHKPSRVRELEEEARWDREVTGLTSTLWSREELRERGHAGPEAHGALHHAAGFGLHPLKYHRGLTRAALARGVTIHDRSRVTGWVRQGGGHRLVTSGGSLRAKRVLIATNGYTTDALHPHLAGTFLPALSNIVTTRPLTAAEQAAQGWTTGTPLSDSRNLLFYFRLLADGRLLLGARGGTWGSPEASASYRRWLEGRIGIAYPAWRGVETTHFWSGLVCLSANLTPMLGQVPENSGVWYALAYHGNGVASAGWAGRAIAHAMTGGPVPGVGIPALMATAPTRFPLGPWRRWLLKAAYLKFMVQDLL